MVSQNTLRSARVLENRYSKKINSNFKLLSILSNVIQIADFTAHMYVYISELPSYANTICPGSSDTIYIVIYYVKWVTTSWTYSTTLYIDLYRICFRKCLRVWPDTSTVKSLQSPSKHHGSLY